MKEKIRQIIKKVRNRIFFTIVHFYDMRICGRSLSEYIPSVFRDDKNGVGSTGSQSTHYPILKKIFRDVEIKESDVFLDVGCGMGRVLAFCIKEKYPCSINGVEINEVPGKIAEEWSRKYNNVHVTIGDAFQLDYDQHNVLFLGRPFLPKTFEQFLNLFESQVTHPITFIYWVDQQSGYLLNGRKGWTRKTKGIIDKMYGLKVHDTPQGYSIWEYEPQNETEKKIYVREKHERVTM